MWADLGGYAGTRHSLDDEVSSFSTKGSNKGGGKASRVMTANGKSSSSQEDDHHPLLQKAEKVKELLKDCKCGMWGLLPLEELLFTMFLVGMEGIEAPDDESDKSVMFHHPFVYELRDVALVSYVCRLLSLPKALGSLLAGELKPRPLQLHFVPPALLMPAHHSTTPAGVAKKKDKKLQHKTSSDADKETRYSINLIDYNVKTDAGCLCPCIAAASSGWTDRAIESLFYKKGEAIHPSVPSLENMNSAAGMFGNIPLLQKLFDETRPSQAGDDVSAPCAALTAACSVGDVRTVRWILDQVRREVERKSQTLPMDPNDQDLLRARRIHTTLTSAYSGMVPAYNTEEKVGHWIHAASPMHAALRSRCVSLVSYLLKVEASARHVLNSHYASKNVAKEKKGSLATEVAKGTPTVVAPYSTFKAPQGFVLLAAEIGSLALMRTLHEEVEGGGFDFAERSNEGLTPLMVAAASGDLALVQFLLREVGGFPGETEYLDSSRMGGLEKICSKLHATLGLYSRDTVVGQDALQWAEGSEHGGTINALKLFFPKPDEIEV